MANSMQTINYLNIIPYSSFNSWDVKYFLKKDSFFKPTIPLVLFGEFLSKSEIKKVNIEDNNTYEILGVRSYGKGAFINREVKGNTLKMRVYQQAKPNHLFWCKVDTKNGAFGIITEELSKGLGSSNMTFAEIDIKKANADFIQILFKSKRIYEYLDGFVTGTTNRKYIRPDQLINEIFIPLPALEEQNKIVARYNAKLQLAQQQEQQAKTLETEIERYLFDELGVEHKKDSYEKKIGSFLKIYKYSEFDKWGANQNNSNKIISNNSFELKKIKDICTVSSGGTPSRERKEYYKGNIPWIKTGEVVNGIIYDTEEKITKEAIENSSAKIYPKDSLIIAMYGQGTTRGRTAKLGIDASTNQACAVLFNINNSVILTDYLWLYLMGEYDRMREMASGNNQPNLNAQMLKDYNVIIPPFEIQTKIINTINSIKAKINELNVLSAKNKEVAIIEFENEIFN